MREDRNVGNLAAAAFVTAAVVLVGNALVARRGTADLVGANEWVTRTVRVQRAHQELLVALADAEAEQRSYLLTADPARAARFDESRADVARRVDAIQALTAGNARQQERIAAVRPLVAARLDALERNRRLGPNKWDRAVLDAGQGRAAEIEAVLDAVGREEEELLAGRQAAADRSRDRTLQTFTVATLVALAAVAGGFLLVRRDSSARRRLATERRTAADDREKAAQDRERAAAEREDLAARNALLLESSGEGIYGIDKNGTCTFANAAAVRALGLESAADVLGKDTHPLFHHTRPDGTPYSAADCPIYRAVATGVAAKVDDDVFFRPDGSSVPVEYSASPVRRDGRVDGAVVVFSDITRRKASEAVLRDREERFSTMAEAIPQLAWMTDATGAIVWYNQRWYDYTGTTFDQVKGDGWKAVHHPDHLEHAAEKFRRAVAAGVPWEDTFPLRRHTGEYRAFLSRAVPVRGPDGKVTRWFGTNTDVEDQQRVERELAAAKEQADAANQAKSQFLANMSHELRTPLNAVILYSELLQEEAEDRGVAEFVPDLEKIRVAGKHLLALINDVLDLSKIEAGKVELYLETFGVAQAVEEVLSTALPLVQKNDNKLETRVADAAGEVKADLTKVRQVLFNLVSNAAKFTDRGTITVAADRGEKDGRDVVTFRVTDTGIGMTPEQVARLFQPFSQADESTTRKYGGTGLGLSISVRFAELMGGSLAVESEAGKGTTFVFTLPAEVVSADATRAAGDVRPFDGAALVIDDDPEARAMIIRTLAEEGVPAVEAADGEEGLRLAKAFTPGVIFLDVVMPKMDGWAVLTALKADPRLADVPVVMVSMSPGRDLGYLLGAAEFVAKPVDTERLHGLVRKYAPGGPEGGVLVVDDDAATREVVARVLAREGWPVTEAGNGREALERMAAARFGLVILDLLMPEMNGFDFLDAVRRQEAFKDVPVVLMTSKDLTPDDRARLAGQVEAIVQKGAYGREDLLREVRRMAQTFVPRPAARPAGESSSQPPDPAPAASP